MPMQILEEFYKAENAGGLSKIMFFCQVRTALFCCNESLFGCPCPPALHAKHVCFCVSQLKLMQCLTGSPRSLIRRVVTS